MSLRIAHLSDVHFGREDRLAAERALGDVRDFAPDLVVVTGDLTQVDLPTGKRSGLSDAVEVLRGIEGISFVYFDERDVVRHPLVQKIVKAYERHQETIGGRQLALKLTESAAEPTSPASQPLPVAPADNREIPLV